MRIMPAQGSVAPIHPLPRASLHGRGARHERQRPSSSPATRTSTPPRSRRCPIRARSTSRARAPTSACRCARSRSPTRRHRSAPKRIRRSYVYDTSGPYTDPAAQIDIRSGLPRAARALDRRARRHRGARRADVRATAARALADPELAELRFDLHAHAAPRASRARTSRRCTTRGAASSRRRWSSSRSARTCSATKC